MFDLDNYLSGFSYMRQEFSPIKMKPLLELTCVGVKERTYPEYIIDNSKRDWYTYRFQYTISGSGILELDGKKYVLEQHDAFFVFLPGNSKYYPNPDVKEPWRFVYLTFIKSPGMAQPIKNFMEANGPVFHLSPNSGAIRALVNIINKRKNGELYEPLLTTAAALDFFYQLYYCTTSRNTELSPRIQKIIAYINAQYHTLSGVEEIASHFHISSGYLTREFTKELGMNPIEYLTEARINRAMTLLENTSLPVKDIAAQCGFSSAGYFSKVFRKYTKMSPLQYREQNS